MITNMKDGAKYFIENDILPNYCFRDSAAILPTHRGNLFQIKVRTALKYSVSIVKSNSHYDGVANALRLIENQIEKEVVGKKRVLVKPNFVSIHRQLAATHVDAVRAVLDILRKHYAGKITIGEGPSSGRIEDGLRNFNYLQLQDAYDVEFVDLNEDNYIEVEALDQELKPMKLHMSKTVTESDYRISVAIPKTHDRFIATLSIKNMAVGSLIGYHKGKVHFGYNPQNRDLKTANLNIAKMGQMTMPHLGVLDGFVGMEGSGPISGEQVDLRVAAASIHPVSLDAVMAKIMGFNPQDIGYLHFLHEWTKSPIDPSIVNILGVTVEEVARKFNPHPAYRDMLQWKDE
jgi:uncharacterized protein (DUF362 family)